MRDQKTERLDRCKQVSIKIEADFYNIGHFVFAPDELIKRKVLELIEEIKDWNRIQKELNNNERK